MAIGVAKMYADPGDLTWPSSDLCAVHPRATFRLSSASSRCFSSSMRRCLASATASAAATSRRSSASTAGVTGTSSHGGLCVARDPLLRACDMGIPVCGVTEIQRGRLPHDTPTVESGVLKFRCRRARSSKMRCAVLLESLCPRLVLSQGQTRKKKGRRA